MVFRMLDGANVWCCCCRLQRLAREAEEKEQRRHRHTSRTEEDDGSAHRESWRDNDPRVESKTDDVSENTAACSSLEDRLKDAKATALSNQDEGELVDTMVVKAAAVSDPMAITKIVDFCEELKKQNEDVKKQLLEQHAVLTSLRTTLAVEANEKAFVADSRRRNSGVRGSIDKARIDKLAVSSSKQLQPVIAAPRPRPLRGDTKIPLPRGKLSSSLRTAGADIINGLTPQNASKHFSPPKKEAEERVDTCDRFDVASSGKVSDPAAPCPTKHSSAKTVFPKSSQIKAISQEFETTAPTEKVGGGSQWSPPKQPVIKITLAHEINEDIEAIAHTSRFVFDNFDNDDCLIQADSKLIHDWENESAGDESLTCSSIPILEGPSSLVPLDRSPYQLF
ncbi:unnamed protein product [Phytophthora lilii]|uniref:Unnamed protein product n=1 Tax=Phytophthora lilii TaxID=2077276 RepID=A0A9W6YIS6_9STRA|nr:unnamed protein product [Phytophthora lilii]